jgi:signal recognition particle subunit SRP54
MGDVLTLIDKAQQQFDEKKAAELEQKLRKSLFTLDDYLDQLGQIKNMGNIEQLMGMIPGMKPGALKDAKIDENALAHTEAIIRAMTMKEREHPEIINASRKIRIAKGSGTSVEDVNKLLKQFDQMKKMIKQFSGGGGKRGPFGKMKIPF